jgi:uncharacterized damage-inducible protein DinB
MNYGALFLNLEGISHEESLVQPESGGNCLNWVLGHMIATRNRILQLVGEAPVWPREQAVLYSGREGSNWTRSSAAHLNSLKADLARSQQQLIAALERMSDSDLAAPTRDGGGAPLGEVLGFFHFHESYHGGQVALLRRLVGKPGVIKPPQSRTSPRLPE